MTDEQRELLLKAQQNLEAKTPDRVEITAHNPDSEKAMEAYSGVSRKYRNALREMAK